MITYWHEAQKRMRMRLAKKEFFTVIIILIALLSPLLLGLKWFFVVIGVLLGTYSIFLLVHAIKGSGARSLVRGTWTPILVEPKKTTKYDRLHIWISIIYLFILSAISLSVAFK